MILSPKKGGAPGGTPPPLEIEEVGQGKDFATSYAYKKEGVWGSYKAPRFNGGIHGLLRIRRRRTRHIKDALQWVRAQGGDLHKGGQTEGGIEERSRNARL